MAGHMGIDGNKTADQLAGQDSSQYLTGSEPALGVSSKVVTGMIRDWTGRKSRSIGSPFVDKGRLQAFLTDPLLKELGNSST